MECFGDSAFMEEKDVSLNRQETCRENELKQSYGKIYLQSLAYFVFFNKIIIIFYKSMKKKWMKSTNS